MTQEQALAILESGESVLITGAAGTGKTHVLNDFISRARTNGKKVAVTATTGLAATHLNGTTIHSWAGIGIADSLDKSFFKKIAKSRLDIINRTEILVIDEISMLHNFRFEMVDQVLRYVKNNDKPFGGIQVVMSGDFYQLPPVSRDKKETNEFVINSGVWQSGVFSVCYLDKHYRQSKDASYREILNGIRAGKMPGQTLKKLLARIKRPPVGFVSTRLLTTNSDVNNINDKELANIDSPAESFEMTISGAKRFREQLQKSCLAVEHLRLKIGAQVMFIRNSQDKRYVNGSLGEVVDFDEDNGYPLIRLQTGRLISVEPETWELNDGEKRRASLSQLPLRLAWAITVHKSQGMTIDGARIDLRKAFVEGMGYVALSRVRSLDDLYLDGINNMALKVSPLAKAIDAELRSASQQSVKSNHQLFEDWHKAETRRSKQQSTKTQPAKKLTWAEKLAKMRLKHPNAYKPWATDHDNLLKKMHAEGHKISVIASKLGRHHGSIEARLKKHYGEDLALES